MKDIYFEINPACCKWPRLQLIHEVSMGYLPAVYCCKCNKMQGPAHVPKVDGQE